MEVPTEQVSHRVSDGGNCLVIQVHIIFWKHTNAIDQTCNVIVMTRKYKTEPTTFVDVVSFHLTLPSVDMLGCSICSGCRI